MPPSYLPRTASVTLVSHAGTLRSRQFFSLFRQWTRAFQLTHSPGRSRISILPASDDGPTIHKVSRTKRGPPFTNPKHGLQIRRVDPSWRNGPAAASRGSPFKNKPSGIRHDLVDSPNPRPLSSTLRHLMRRMPSSVTILTTDPVPDRADSHSTIKKPPGMTLSTFTTLSLHPVPLVTFNVRLPSSTYDSITLYPSQPFYIHFPASTLDGAALARHFSGLRSGGKTTPTDLTGSESLVASLKCQMEGLEGWHVNDHVIVVARVLAISSPSPSPSSSRSAPASVDEGSVLEHQRMEQGPEGLMYINRSYRSAGPRIDPPSS